MRAKLVKFCLSSLSAFLADYLLYIFFIFILSDSAKMVLVSNIAARVISASFNYHINRKYVFKASGDMRSAASYFALALFILVMNSLVLELLTQQFHISAIAAKPVTECIMFAVSWTIQNHIIFRRRDDDEKK